MKTKTTRQHARQWLDENYPTIIKFHSSKFYQPEQSWSKEECWFPTVPVELVNMAKGGYLHILCQKQKDETDFIYLKVPARFFQAHENDFKVVGKSYSLMLSAVPGKEWLEWKSGEKISFKEFVVNP